MSTDCVGMAIRVIEHHGLSYERKQGTHEKIVIEHEGKKRVLCCGSTTSDKRAIKNFFSTIRRVLTEMGVEFKADSKSLIHN